MANQWTRPKQQVWLTHISYNSLTTWFLSLEYLKLTGFLVLAGSSEQYLFKKMRVVKTKIHSTSHYSTLTTQRSKCHSTQSINSVCINIEVCINLDTNQLIKRPGVCNIRCGMSCFLVERWARSERLVRVERTVLMTRGAPFMDLRVSSRCAIAQ